MTVTVFTILPEFYYFACEDDKKFNLKTTEVFTCTVPDEWRKTLGKHQ